MYRETEKKTQELLYLQGVWVNCSKKNPQTIRTEPDFFFFY